MKGNQKILIIVISLLLLAAVTVFVFRKKIFKKDVANGDGTDNTNAAPVQPATVPATIQSKNFKPGAAIYAQEEQEVQRIKTWGGYYHTFDEKTGVPYGKAVVNADTFLGTFIKKYNNEKAYVKANPAFSFPYYLVNLETVYTK